MRKLSLISSLKSTECSSLARILCFGLISFIYARGFKNGSKTQAFKAWISSLGIRAKWGWDIAQDAKVSISSSSKKNQSKLKILGDCTISATSGVKNSPLKRSDITLTANPKNSNPPSSSPAHKKKTLCLTLQAVGLACLSVAKRQIETSSEQILKPNKNHNVSHFCIMLSIFLGGSNEGI